MTDSNIFFLDPGQEPTARISQLFPHLELYADGNPVQNTLFVQGEQPPRLLIIDPPADASQRFRLEGDVAALYTGTPVDVGLPLVGMQPGGVAHIRIGDHFLDIYSQESNNIVHFPTLGVLCGGGFGSDLVLPSIGDGSDGGEELDTLRLLASLLKRKHFQLFLPAFGTSNSGIVDVMKRLAADVSYLNALRSVIAEGRQREEAVETIETACQVLLPPERSTALSQEVHDTNVERLMRTLEA